MPKYIKIYTRYTRYIQDIQDIYKILAGGPAPRRPGRTGTPASGPGRLESMLLRNQQTDTIENYFWSCDMAPKRHFATIGFCWVASQ